MAKADEKEEGFQVVSIKVDFMCVGFRGDVVADGRVEGHMGSAGGSIVF